jgi:hypothetical protein
VRLPARVCEGLAANVVLDRGSQCFATADWLTVHDEQPDAENLLQVRDPDADVRGVVLEQSRGGWVLWCKTRQARCSDGLRLRQATHGGLLAKPPGRGHASSTR